MFLNCEVSARTTIISKHEVNIFYNKVKLPNGSFRVHSLFLAYPREAAYRTEVKEFYHNKISVCVAQIPENKKVFLINTIKKRLTIRVFLSSLLAAAR